MDRIFKMKKLLQIYFWLGIIGVIATACFNVTKPVVNVKYKATCQDVCDHFAEMRCDEAKGSPGPNEVFGDTDDRLCTTLCQEYYDDPYLVFDLDRLSKIKTCEEIKEDGD